MTAQTLDLIGQKMLMMLTMVATRWELIPEPKSQ